MKKNDVLNLNDSELFAAYYGITVQLVKEANSMRGETKKSAQQANWIIEECIKRFGLDRDVLIAKELINE